MLAGSNFDFIVRYKRAQEEETTHPGLRAWPPTRPFSQVLLCGADSADAPGPAPWTPAAARTTLHPRPPTTGDQTLALPTPKGQGGKQGRGQTHYQMPSAASRGPSISWKWQLQVPCSCSLACGGTGRSLLGPRAEGVFRSPALSTKGLTGAGVSSRWCRCTRRAHRP